MSQPLRLLRHFIIALCFGAVVSAPLAAVAAPASIVSDDPENWTPHVTNGIVYSIAEVGDQMVVGGDFSTVHEDQRVDPEQRRLGRNNVMAFNTKSGAISPGFNPGTNGPVNVVIDAGDGKHVFIGGSFTTVGGYSVRNLAKVRVSDGAVDTSFNAGHVAGKVHDLRLVNGKLWVAGAFTHIAGFRQQSLATLDPRTGYFDRYMNAEISGVHNRGYTTINAIEATSTGDRLIAIGNIRNVNGQTRRQVALFDLAGDSVTLADFDTSYYSHGCNSGFNSYVRDVDISPDDSFFVIVTTGGYGGSAAPCDGSARFETYAQGGGQQPTWVNLTGGDTLHSVKIHEGVAYVGGHQQWMNNDHAYHRADSGAVYRPGIAALDVRNGVAFSWNPTRTRGIGVMDMAVSDDGLWVVSDTDRIGQGYEYHGRIALMPFAGGTTVASEKDPEIPNDLYTVTTSGTATKRSFDGTGAGQPQSAPSVSGSGTLAGAFMLNGDLYSAWATSGFFSRDGRMTKRSFDGERFGPATEVNAADQLVRNTAWADDLRLMRGMFYDNGRIYFVRSDSNALYYRYFTAESGIVGTMRYTAQNGVSSLSLSSTRGMVKSGEHVYVVASNGTLRRFDWNDSPRAGTLSNASEAVAGVNGLNGQDIFLFQNEQGNGAPQPPTAAFTVDCTSLTCTFDASESVSPGAEITDWDWDFGDGETANGKTVEHTFAASGTRSVTLTITTSAGHTATIDRELSVTRVNQGPVAAFESSCDDLVCSFDAGPSVDSDGDIVAWEWSIDGVAVTGQSVSHEFGQPGTYDVSLTVTDNEGATGFHVQPVTVTDSNVTFVDAASANANTSAAKVTVPATVEEGDLLLLTLTSNVDDVEPTVPNGWEEIVAESNAGMETTLWTKVAEAGDIGANLTVTTSTTTKTDLTVSAWRGTTGTPSVADHTVVKDRATDGLTVPQQAGSDGGRQVLHVATKSSADVALHTGDDWTRRAASTGAGGGRITAGLFDRSGSENLDQSEMSFAPAASRALAIGIVLARH